MTHLSLFSGIGGLDIAAEWAGFETVGQCEWADYPTKVLEKHWPDVPRWRDIRTLTKENFYERTGRTTVDVISGGFPCQPFSVAGKQKGKEDNRYLWPEMLRVIRELKPNYVVGENVPGIINIAADEVCADLEREGYEVRIFNFEAAAVGAPHRRDRVAFVAQNANRLRRNSEEWEKESEIRRQRELGSGSIQRIYRSKDVAYPLRNGHSDGESQIIATKAGEYAQCNIAGCCEDVANTPAEGFEGADTARDTCAGGWDMQCIGGDWWATEPDVGRTLDGFSSWLDRHDGLTNETHKRIMTNWIMLMGGQGNAATEETRPGEILRVLRNENGTKDLQRCAGRYGRIHASEILLTYLRKLQETSTTLGNLSLESGEVKEKLLRSLWVQDKSASASHRPEPAEQYAGEHPDALQALSRLLAHDSEAAWTQYCGENAQSLLSPWSGDWENGIPRVAHGISNRVDRLKALGNAVVPQQFYPIFKAIAELEGE